ncbi:hypothetical protein FRB95_002775 [Tulasnella sp. JGI-2019a]|nr:hypothetical protein FRB95_002775 [Tulasnella sp. JGI-2019a]
MGGAHKHKFSGLALLDIIYESIGLRLDDIDEADLEQILRATINELTDDVRTAAKVIALGVQSTPTISTL